LGLEAFDELAGGDREALGDFEECDDGEVGFAALDVAER